jgi:uncharacterized protein
MPPRMDVATLVSTLGLSPHPEGGFFGETYRSREQLPTDRGERALATSIYFLITPGSFSALHRIRSDEHWYFHSGAPLEIVTFDAQGRRDDLRLGLDLISGERPYACVPAGRVFGSRLAGPGTYSLVSCVVAPGFDFADFELPTRTELLALYPQHASIVTELTRGS